MIKDILRYLFGREHLARTFWGLIGGAAIFFLGVWYNAGKEPAKVFVTNTSSMQDTIVLRIEGQSKNPRDALEGRIEQLIREVGTLRRSMNTPNTKGTYSTPERLEPRPLSPSNQSKSDWASDKLIGVPLASELSRAQVKVPKYQLPSEVKGYKEGKLSSFAKMSLPKAEFRKGQEISFTIELIDPSILGKMTPLGVNILRKNSEHNFTLLYSQQFTLQQGTNLVTLLADFGNGKLIFEVGFYIVDEVNQTYPPFYRTQNVIIVKE